MMNQKEFSIVHALAMASMKHPNSAITNHITRLIKNFDELGESDRAEKLRSLLNRDNDIPNPKVTLS